MLPVNAQPTLWEVLLPEMCLGMPAELEAVDGMLDDAGFFEPFRAHLHTVSTTRQRFHSVASYKESSPNNCWDSCWDTAQLSGVRWPRKAATRAYSEPEMGFEPMTCALRVRCSTTELPGRLYRWLGAGSTSSAPALAWSS